MQLNNDYTNTVPLNNDYTNTVPLICPKIIRLTGKNKADLNVWFKESRNSTKKVTLKDLKTLLIY